MATEGRCIGTAVVKQHDAGRDRVRVASHMRRDFGAASISGELMTVWRSMHEDGVDGVGQSRS
jgi:hypothetical protein